ncbi:MAG: LamB/YcsF family protein [Flavipsychrobacter sp.]|nr:LamB/YcsF family protein [Flavipsychrobacter sp.]
MELNCDLGEGTGNEALILPFIHTANISCGLHAGTPSEISKTIELAKKQHVQIGAHPSWDDRSSFGRTEQQLPASEIISLILYQLGAFDALCRQHNYPMKHIKPHGALYNQAAKDPIIATAIITAIKTFNPTLQLYALSNSVLAKLGKEAGLMVKEEAFADRRYTSSGDLASRQLPNAVLKEKKEVLQQVKELLFNKRVRTTEETWIPLKADTLCIHGDGPTAVELAKSIHEFLQQSHCP